MDQRTVLKETLERARASMVAHLTEIDCNRKIYPLWTIREILAHISGWDDAVIAIIRALLAGETPPAPAVRGGDVYNAETVSTREGLDYDHIYREYLATRQLLLGLLRELPEAKVDQPSLLPWGASGTLAELIKMFADHEITHAGDVQKIIEAARQTATP